MDELQSDPIVNTDSSVVSRRMERAVLMGSHTHRTTNGVSVHIYQRDGKFLARGRYNKQAFGETLGSDEEKATSRLRHILTEIELGSYVRPRDASKRPMGNGTVPQLRLRNLANEFLAEKRKMNGAKTARDYRNRLAPILDFSETLEALRRWRLAADIDREFAVELRKFLTKRMVARNGHSNSDQKLMSPRQVHNCMSTLRMVLVWALRADVRKLSPNFVNPITKDVIGQTSRKDPLRKSKLPMSRRIELVNTMDAWQFLHLSTLVVLPLRFEDVAGALISDIDYHGQILHVGTRFGGNDFNKERLNVEMPLPTELISVLRTCAGERTEGPLFRSRTVWDGRRKTRLAAASRDDIERLLHDALAAAPDDTVQCEQDRKAVFRELLRGMGGVSERQIGKALTSLLKDAGLAERTRPYDVRGSVTTDMNEAGIRHLELRYLTLHSVDDILNEYTGLDPVNEMAKYFRHCQPLLTAIQRRAIEFGIYGEVR